MPELAIHFSVVFALTTPRLGIKRALLISLIAILPDLDVLVHVHRSMSHSILVILLVCTPILLLVYRFKTKYFKLAVLALLALLSHPLMDLFQTYTPILYPLLDRSLWVKIDGSVLIHPGGVDPRVSATIRGKPTVFRSFRTLDAPIFTNEGFMISLLLIAVPALPEIREILVQRLSKS